MARQIIERLIDDLTGEPIAEGEGETIEFAVNGVGYTIDLSAENAQAYREALSRFVAAATPIKTAGTGKAVGKAVPPTTPAKRRRGARGDAHAIREWARSAGYQVSERGRVSEEVRQAYRQAWTTDEIGH